MKAYGGGGIASEIINLDTGWRRASALLSGKLSQFYMPQYGSGRCKIEKSNPNSSIVQPVS
jgi:hypothetical protein